MEFKFTQFEIEAGINDILVNGDRKDIADRMGRSESIISQMCNPDDDRESDFSKAAKFIAAAIGTDQERGRALLQLLNLMCERHVDFEAVCPVTETTKFNKELNELLDAVMTAKPLPDQIKELDDVINQATALKRAKLKELNGGK